MACRERPKLDASRAEVKGQMVEPRRPPERFVITSSGRVNPQHFPPDSIPREAQPREANGPRGPRPEAAARGCGPASAQATPSSRMAPPPGSDCLPERPHPETIESSTGSFIDVNLVPNTRPVVREIEKVPGLRKARKLPTITK